MNKHETCDGHARVRVSYETIEVRNRSELELRPDIKEWKISCSLGKVKKHGNYFKAKLKIQ